MLLTPEIFELCKGQVISQTNAIPVYNKSALDLVGQFFKWYKGTCTNGETNKIRRRDLLRIPQIEKINKYKSY